MMIFDSSNLALLARAVKNALANSYFYELLNDFDAAFLDMFLEFCEEHAEEGQTIVLSNEDN